MRTQTASAAGAAGLEPAAAGPPRCRCGHDRNHHMVSASPQYSFIGWCAILIGISYEPRSVSFNCRRCDQVLERTSNRDEIEKLRV